MGSLSLTHWLLVLVVVLLMFGGRGKISAVMGDFAKGIKAFKHGMKEEDNSAEASAPQARAPHAAAIEGEAKSAESRDTAPKH